MMKNLRGYIARGLRHNAWEPNKVNSDDVAVAAVAMLVYRPSLLRTRPPTGVNDQTEMTQQGAHPHEFTLLRLASISAVYAAATISVVATAFDLPLSTSLALQNLANVG